jgi:hypothetical protein
MCYPATSFRIKKRKISKIETKKMKNGFLIEADNDNKLIDSSPSSRNQFSLQVVSSELNLVALSLLRSEKFDQEQGH